MFQSSHLTDQVPLKGELISRVISQKISIMKHRGTKGWKYWKKWKAQKKIQKKVMCILMKLQRQEKKGRRNIWRDDS